MLNVLILSQSLKTGGLEHMVLTLAANLDKDHFQASVGCLGQAGDLESLARQQGIEVHSLNKPAGVQPRTVLRLRSLLKKQKIDVLHTHNAGCLLYGVPAARLAGVPVIIHTEHGRMLHEFDNQKVNRAERFLSRWVNEIVAVSEPTRQKYSGITGIPPGKIQVVPNGIDIKRFQVAAKATLREQLGIRAEDHVAGNVARLSPEKNQALFLRASVRVLRECKNLKVLLVGDGPERNSLEKLVDDLGIRHKVIFAGQRQDIADLLALMDIFVLSSSTEGMPMTLLEAMAAGKAIVCTAAGGIPGVIQDGENGLLCPCGDEEALSNCISGLIRQRDLAAKLRARARKDAENKYSVRHMAGQYEQMYKKHMKGHSN